MAKDTNSTGLSLTAVLLIVFITLKLAGAGEVATWSWWMVFSPVWIPLVLVMAVAILYGVFLFISNIYSHYSNKKK